MAGDIWANTDVDMIPMPAPARTSDIQWRLFIIRPVTTSVAAE